LAGIFSMGKGGKKQTQQQNIQTNQSGTTASRTMPVAPAGWEAAWNGMQPGANGFTADQAGANDFLTGQIGAFARGPGTYFSGAMNRSPTTLASLATLYPDVYGQIEDVTVDTVSPTTVSPTNVSATQIGFDPVSAQQGSEFMSAYRNPFEDQVVAGALGDLERKHNLALTAAGNRQQAAGAFGGSATALENALIGDDYRRTVANTTAGLRSDGFKTAAGLGMQDATRSLQAGGMNQVAGLDAARANQAAGLDAARANQAVALQAGGMNQEAALRAALANQSSRLTAATQNQNNQTQRQEFDVDAIIKNTQMSDQAARDLASTMGMDIDTAKAVLQSGALGQGQNMDWLRMGGLLFGQDQVGATNASGTQNGTTTTTTSGGSGLGSLLGGGLSLASLFTGAGPLAGLFGGASAASGPALAMGSMPRNWFGGS
jgi:hypothetical protein